MTPSRGEGHSAQPAAQCVRDPPTADPVESMDPFNPRRSLALFVSGTLLYLLVMALAMGS